MSLNVYASKEGDPLARGVEIGRALRPRIQGTVRDYAWLFEAAGLDERTVRTVAEETYGNLRDWAPELATEIAGIAQGARLERWQAAALNCRTEIVLRGNIAGLSECTAAVLVPADGPPRALQTWDWIPQVHNFTALRLVSDTGMPLATFTENGVIGKAGVNGAGLGLLFTLLCHTSDGSRPGVPIHAVARHILGTAETVADAVAIARAAPVTASASMTFVHSDGSAATVEISPAGTAVLTPSADPPAAAPPSESPYSQRGFLLHTNHFLDPALAAGDRLAAIGDDTLPRMDELLRRRTVLAAGDRTDWARGLTSHWADGAPICAHPREGAPPTDRWETKMLISPDVERRVLMLQEGGPCRATADGWIEVPATEAPGVAGPGTRGAGAR